MRRFWRRNADDFDNELRAHLAHEEAELRASGMSVDDARAEARRRFGNVTLARERVHDNGRLRWLGTLWQDVRYGVRLMRRSPGFSLTAVLILALGIGVNTALFSVVNALFFAPLPVRAPEELFYVHMKWGGPRTTEMIASDDFAPVIEHTRAFADYTRHWPATLRLSIDGDAQFAAGELVSGDYFTLLGIDAAHGRVLSPADDSAAAGAVAVVIGHEYWERRFNSDPAIVGRRVRLQDLDAVVVGVARQGFSGLTDPWSRSQFWASESQFDGLARPGEPVRMHGLPIGRLKPGVTASDLEAAIGAATAVWRREELARISELPARNDIERLRAGALLAHFPVRRAAETRLPFDPEQQLLPPALVAGVSALVILVLFISTMNIAGLLLARGLRRSSEIAMRRALGAGRDRIGRQLLTESALLAVIASLLGLALAVLFVGAARAFTPAQYAVSVPIDVRVLGFTALVCCGAAVLIGVAPAVQALRVHVLQALGQGIAGSGTSRRQLRQWVVVPQVALSLVTLVIAGVHGRSLLRLETADRGYQTDGVTAITVSRPVDQALPSLLGAPAAVWRKAVEDRRAEARALTTGILQRIEALPGVAAVGLTQSLLLEGAASLPTYVLTKSADGERHARAVISPALGNFHGVMQMRIVRGRSFEPRDVTTTRPVAVVSERLGRDLFGAADPIGQVLTPEVVHRVDTGQVRAIPTATWFEIIGVVNDVESIVSQDQPRPRLYISALHAPMVTTLPLVVVRSRSTAGAVVRDVAAAVSAVDSRLEVARVQSLSQVASQLLFPRRIGVGVLIAAGLAALILACIGLYGIASYAVADRTREIGIRATLGAGRQDIVALMLRDGAVVTVWGVAAGALISWVALRWSATIAPYASTTDAVALCIIPLALIGAVLLACYLPARRASRVDPAQVLRGL
jgi:predicted permease